MAQLLTNHDEIISVFHKVKTIAMVGASPNPARPSFGVMQFLLGKGYKVIPINPGHAGGEILGQKVVAHLQNIDEPIDMVDIFRNIEAIPKILDETLLLAHKPYVFWMQLGLVDDVSAKRAIKAGLNVVMNHCPAIELSK